MTIHHPALDEAAALADEAWDLRMAEALAPLPPAPRPCPTCEGRALGPEALPCVPCRGLGVTP